MIVKERYKKYEFVKKYETVDAEAVKDIELTFEGIVKRQRNEKVVMKSDMDDYCVNSFQSIAVNHIPVERFVHYHSHSFYEINFIFAGRMHQYIDSRMYSINPGTLVILSPSAVHSVYCERESNGINILIDKKFFEKNATELSYLSHGNFLSRLSGKDSYAFIDISGIPSICSLLEIISSFKYKTTAAFSVENSYFEKMLEHMLYAVQLEITEENITPVFENSIDSAKESSSDRILDYIKSNLADITLEKTAKHFGYSTMSIHRIIKAQTGNNFTVYVSKLRINLAKYLLKKTSLPIGEIALRTGCNTSEYFGKFFKKHIFMTPSRYRKEYLKTRIEDITS